VSRKHGFEKLSLTDQFKKSYRKLTTTSQTDCDVALKQLRQKELPPGLRTKPIRPNNVYYEARTNDGDRLVLYPVSNTAYIMDVVKHDDIDKWGRIKKPELS
jgi:hypothetical protein